MSSNWLIVLVAVPVFVGAVAPEPAFAEQPKKLECEQREVTAELDATCLVLLEPILFPHPKLDPADSVMIERKVAVGDIIQFQGKFVVAPPFPLKASLKASNKSLTPLAITRTWGRPPGVGYIIAYLRASSPGECQATISASYTDGKTRDITSTFKISEREK